MRKHQFVCFILALTLTLASLPVQASQSTAAATAQNSAFTVDDLLDVVSLNIADFSEDGKWIVATSSTLRDRIGINNQRFGDPTYIAPALAEILLIEAQTGKTQKVFANRRQVRGLKLSPDAAYLAMMILEGDAFKPVVWERKTGVLTNFTLPHGKIFADNSEFEWSADSKEVLLSLRNAEWNRKAAERFTSLTSAPIVVLSGKEPFLAWEDLRRMANMRSLAVYNIKTFQLREVVADSRINSYDLSEDGSFITYSEDLTKKTDYDTIGGSDNQLQLIQASGGAPRTLIKSTKGLNLIWSRDNRRYAYSKDGNLFFASIEDKEPRQLTGKKEEAKESGKALSEAEKKEADKADDKAKPKKETFNAVRLSANGDWLIASNKEGLWLMDTATGSRENFLKMNEEDKDAPRYQVSELCGAQ
jgi:hypothetical protein